MDFLTNNWFYLLFAGIMLYFMYRGGSSGCCGGHDHGEGTNGGNTGGCGGHGHGEEINGRNTRDYGEHNQNSNINTNYGDSDLDSKNMSSHDTMLIIVTDPVCGMEVNTETSPRYTINGINYYFCSETCMKEFMEKN